MTKLHYAPGTAPEKTACGLPITERVSITALAENAESVTCINCRRHARTDKQNAALAAMRAQRDAHR